jgi:hypothetical protein
MENFIDQYALSIVISYCTLEDIRTLYKNKLIGDDEVLDWIICYGDFDAYYLYTHDWF